MMTRLPFKTAALLPLGGLLAVAMAVPAPPRVAGPDQAAARAWSAWLDQTLTPMMADCVRFEVEGHVARVDLDAMLARAGGDPRLYPRLGMVVDRAVARCRRRHLIPDD